MTMEAEYVNDKGVTTVDPANIGRFSTLWGFFWDLMGFPTSVPYHQIRLVELIPKMYTFVAELHVCLMMLSPSVAPK